ncbi:hypothetical protein [Azospirillum rugosum]|uniref:Uncharacterized protein n=1 Tax=Azospirillum rugosum TaxID=416170 RepID=A0ABS4SDX3_9PROT|nr:hypothetical protein [Azospirillum rugosum]MBP2290759.1 hypothetical protein [Azospirillum rugosum]MDQ0525648.1 hypothetical protein [Azospirillum rugosum]
MDLLSDLYAKRPAGHRASALELAELARQAIDAGAKVTRLEPQELVARNREVAARRFALASARQKGRMTLNTRAEISASSRRPKSR